MNTTNTYQYYPDEFHSCGIPNENYHRDQFPINQLSPSGIIEISVRICSI